MTELTLNRLPDPTCAPGGDTIQDFFFSKFGYGVDATNAHLLGTTTGTTPLVVTGLQENGLYEFKAMNAADLLDGTPDNLFYKRGAADAAPGNSMPWLCAKGENKLRVRLGKGVTSISFVAANTALTIRVYGELVE